MNISLTKQNTVFRNKERQCTYNVIWGAFF